MTSKPTAREHMELIRNSCTCTKGCSSCASYKFLISLVEAAVRAGSIASEVSDDAIWEWIDERLKPDEKVCGCIHNNPAAMLSQKGVCAQCREKM